MRVTRLVPQYVILRVFPRPHSVALARILMNKQQSWFLVEVDPEGPVYENLSWDMPGVRVRRRSSRRDRSPVAARPSKTA
jgi:hypothetical protein